MKKIIVPGAVLLLLLLVIYFIWSGINNKGPISTGYSIPRTIRYSFTIQNTGNLPAKQGVFRTFGPVKKNSFQKCENITASHLFKIQEDTYGNQVLGFELEPIPPFGSRIITITADLLLSDTANHMDGEDLKPWLKPETYIESSHPEIKKTALSLKGVGPKDTEEKIFNWVADHVVYSGYLKRERGALYAFTQKKGDCTEYMYLFAALTRAVDIPGRGIGGYVLSENSILKPAISTSGLLNIFFTSRVTMLISKLSPLNAFSISIS